MNNFVNKYLGAIIGDTAGSKYEFNNIKTKDFNVLERDCCLTDDSIMTMAIWDMYIHDELHDKEKIIDRFKLWGRKYPNAGYGGRFYYWVLGEERKPYRSYGNGSAMRVSPIGWIANSEEEVKKLSHNVTSVTHNHPAGLKGAEVTAMMIFKARNGASKEELRKYAVKRYPEIKKLNYDDLVKSYYHGEEICQVTMPQALYCFLISDSFEDCLKTTISIGGDCDTTSAISCAIAEAYYKKIPQYMLDKMNNTFLPNDVKEVLLKVNEKLEERDRIVDKYKQFSDDQLELIYYIEFSETLPVLMGTYPRGPIYRELMIKALEEGKPFTFEDLDRKIDELGFKYDLILNDDELN